MRTVRERLISAYEKEVSDYGSEWRVVNGIMHVESILGIRIKPGPAMVCVDAESTVDAAMRQAGLV